MTSTQDDLIAPIISQSIDSAFRIGRCTGRTEILAELLALSNSMQHSNCPCNACHVARFLIDAGNMELGGRT